MVVRYKKEAAVILAVSLFLGSLLSLYYHQRADSIYTDTARQIANQTLDQLEFTARESEHLRYQMKSVVSLLSHSTVLLDYTSSPEPDKKKFLEDNWKSIASKQKWFTQIRFLDLNGMEQVRVNYDVKNDLASTAAELQDKSQRDYFKLSQNIESDEILTTKIGLEVEHGKLVQPYIPTLRLSTPVSSGSGRIGFLITNLDLWYIADRLSYSTDKNLNLEILDESGFFLSSDDKDKLFGSVLSQRSQFNLPYQHPNIWQLMQKKKSGYTYEDNNLFVFNRVELRGEETLYLLVKIEPHRIQHYALPQIKSLEKQVSFVLGLVLLFSIPSLFFSLYSRRRSMESKLAQAALSGMSAVMITDLSYRVLMVNQEFENITGYSSGSIEGRGILRLLFRNKASDEAFSIWSSLAKDRRWEGEIECLTQMGSPFIGLIRIHGVLDHSDKVSYYIVSIVDITERKELEDKFRNLSERDALTQLWNRRKFDETIDHHTALLPPGSESSQTCLALIDIDHFKLINDNSGHDEGDRVIKVVASLLAENVRDSDFVARVGGEEFAIIMPCIGLDNAELLLNRLRRLIEGSMEAPVTISIGYSNFTLDSSETYKKSDIALYESKALGRNRVTSA